jgi:hypothetical protein
LVLYFLLKKDIDAALEKGKKYNPANGLLQPSHKSIGIEPDSVIHKSNFKNYPWVNDLLAIPVNFGLKHKEMLYSYKETGGKRWRHDRN